MNCRFILRQSFELIKKNKLKTVLLIFAVTTGIFFPAAVYSHGRGIINDYNESYYGDRADVWLGDLRLGLDIKNVEELRKIKDINFLKELFSFDPGITISVNAFSSGGSGAAAAFAEGRLFFNGISWRLLDDGSGFVSDSRTAPLLGRDSNSIVLGALFLNKNWAKSLVGKNVTMFGTEYDVISVDNEIRFCLADIQQLTLGAASSISIIFRMTDATEESIDKIIDIMGDHFKIKEVSIKSKISDGSVVSYSMERSLNEYEGAKKNLILSVLITIFCVLNAANILNAVIKDNENAIKIKLSIGARFSQLAMELFAFFFLICVVSSVIVVCISLTLMDELKTYPFFLFEVDFSIIGFMTLASVLVSLFMMLLSLDSLQNANLSVLGR